MKSRALLLSTLVSFSSLMSAGCGSVSEVAPAAPPAVPNRSADEQQKEVEKQQEEQRQRDKDLQQKRRDLDYAKIAVQTAAIDRQIRTMSVEAEVQRTQQALDKHKRELDLFLQQQKPRELEDHKIALDRSGHRAEDAKDELAELEGMYKEDEFARSTKELVIKRGRRGVEIAERELAVGRQEYDEFEKHQLVERETDLRQSIRQAEIELEKARLEHQKAQIELDVQQRQADDRVKDAQRDIAELEQKVKAAAK